MRRQGQYADPGANAYAGTPAQHISGQAMEQHMPDHFQGRLEAFTPEREQPYAAGDGQWRWERDELKISNQMVAKNPGQDVDASGSYYQGKRLESMPALEKQGIVDHRLQPRGENMQLGYGDQPFLLSFEGLEQKFLDDILKLDKEQNDAEDAEIARHREKINAINSQYHERLATLRARHASQRDELLRKESQARQNQYQQAIMEHYPTSGSGRGDPHGFRGVAGSVAANESQRAYNSNNFEHFGDRAQHLSGARDVNYEPRRPYSGGRRYDTHTGARYF